MADYKVELKRSAAKEFEAIDSRRDRRRIVARIRALAKEPRPAGPKKLTGEELYRIRQGDYRIVYSIDDQVLLVVVIKIGHRKDVYR